MQKIDLAYVQLASSEMARDINRNVVLEIVRGNQPISRAELSRISGLQRSTVSLIVNQLIEELWVREGALTRVPRGRRPTMVVLNDNLVMLVADIRPKAATVAVVDLNGRLLSRAQIPVTSDPETTLEAIVETMQRMRENHPTRSEVMEWPESLDTYHSMGTVPYADVVHEDAGRRPHRPAQPCGNMPSRSRRSTYEQSKIFCGSWVRETMRQWQP